MSRSLRPVLRVLAVLEISTLAVLLANLMTVHDPAVARVLGPLHGAAYLIVVLIAMLAPDLQWRTRLLGLLPVIGGAVILRQARRSASTAVDETPTSSP